MAILLQISANTGPAECCLGVARMLGHIESQARKAGLALAVLDEVPGERRGTLQSALVSGDGEDAACRRFAAQQAGTVVWVCPSPYRPGHARKNWYLDVAVFAPPAQDFGDEVVIETMRASGPGGQHVNKTETAVRATHVATGLSVKVSGSRSQSANKATALALLHAKLQAHAQQGRAQGKAERRARHVARPDGAVVRRFVGPGFLEA